MAQGCEVTVAEAAIQSDMAVTSCPLNDLGDGLLISHTPAALALRSHLSGATCMPRFPFLLQLCSFLSV